MQWKQPSLMAKDGEEASHEVGPHVEIGGASFPIHEDIHAIADKIGRHSRQAEKKFSVT
jgi:hypothetical protein